MVKEQWGRSSGGAVVWVARSNGAVGIAVCSLGDTPDENVGKTLARSRADLAQALTLPQRGWGKDDAVVIMVPRPRNGRRRVTEYELLRAFRAACFLKWAARKVSYRHEATEPERWGGFYAWLGERKRKALARLKAERLAVQKTEVEEAGRRRRAALYAKQREQHEARHRSQRTLFGFPVVEKERDGSPMEGFLGAAAAGILRQALKILAEEELRRQVQGNPEAGKPVVGLMGAAATATDPNG